MAVTCLVAFWLILLPLVVSSNVSTDYRLPHSVWPQHYDLQIKTNVGLKTDNFTFKGHVIIEVISVENATKAITLHAKELNILKEQTYVRFNGKTKVPIASQTYDKERDFFIVNLVDPLKPNTTYLLKLAFEGVLGEGLAGLYRSSYVDRQSGETRWLAVTQFEATDARRAFPCFDEPQFKARFSLSIVRVAHYKSISNMPIMSTEKLTDLPDWEVDNFQESVRMSTYLLAFVISDFEHRVSETEPGGVMFRIWARHDALPQTEFASKVGPSILQYFQTYFNVSYPLPKQDMIAIPDFSAGAMENWGLITYRESLLLYDPNVSSISSKVRVASVISHELAHQWFGNLVTMKWWSDLWLNEGFATYVASLGEYYANPKWNALQIDAVDALLIVFSSDALESSHPVSVKIEHTRMIGQIFDAISYKKGGLLLRMMNMFMGEKAFREGITSYLNRYKYSNAEQNDLWHELTQAAHRANVLSSNMTVKQIMDTWTLQTGYPIVTVIRDKGQIIIEQHRYLAYQWDDIRRNPKSEEQQPCWLIPISYTSQMDPDFNDTTPKLWLSCETPRIIIDDETDPEQWLISNIQITGPFRVNYDTLNWKLIQKTLDSDDYKVIGVMNRVQLIEDSMDLAWTGDLDYNITFEVLKYLPRETQYLPWKTTASNLNTLDRVLRRTSGYGAFREYVRRLLVPTYNRFGNLSEETSPEEYEETKLRILVTDWACRLNLGTCLHQAQRLYKEWMDYENPDTDNPIPQDLRSTVYCAAIKYGGEQEWDFAWQRYLQSNVGTEKMMILNSLGCTRETWILRRYLEWSISDNNNIRRQNSYTVFANVAYNDVGFPVAKDFFKQKITEIYDFYSPKHFIMSSYVRSLANEMFLEEEEEELEHLIEKHSHYFEDARLGVQQALDALQVTIDWHQKNYDKFSSLLLKYNV